MRKVFSYKRQQEMKDILFLFNETAGRKKEISATDISGQIMTQRTTFCESRGKGRAEKTSVRVGISQKNIAVEKRSNREGSRE